MSDNLIRGAHGLTVDELLAFHRARFGHARMDARETRALQDALGRVVPDDRTPAARRQLIARGDEILAELERLDRFDELTAAQTRQWTELMTEAQTITHALGTEHLRDGLRSGTVTTISGTGSLGDLGSTVFADRSSARRHPLAYTEGDLDTLQNAIDGRSSARVIAGTTEQRAALTTSTYGAPRVWAANVLAGPRLLHRVAGVEVEPASTIYAQVPNLTLPTAQAGAAENASLAEYASSAPGNVTLARFGRWTDLSKETMLGANAGALVAMHQLGISKDLDTVLINAVEAAAGAAVAFNADVPAAIRNAIATVLDNTGSEDPSMVVVLVNPANAALLQDVTPTGGDTMGQRFQRFSGALVYPSAAVDAGFMTVANLRVGARFFEGAGVATETDYAPKSGTLTVATDTIAGYGVGLVSGFAVKQDVVTP